jgi:hypothetical protein
MFELFFSPRRYTWYSAEQLFWRKFSKMKPYVGNQCLNLGAVTVATHGLIAIKILTNRSLFI